MRRPVSLRTKSMESSSFLQVYQPDIPPALLFHHQPESLGGGAVAAARIKENQVGVNHAPTFS